MNLQLIAQITDVELLLKSVHKDGTLFCQQNKKGHIIRAVYFSSSRIVEYRGRVDPNLAETIRSLGRRADIVDVDESQNSVRIVQT